MIYAVAIIAAVAGIYQLLSLLAAAIHLLRRDSPAAVLPPVSILKPVHGLDPNFLECIRSHASQDYPEFELLFGVSDPKDPSIPAIEQLIAEYPAVPIRLILNSTRQLNRKVGVLQDLAAHARYAVLLANDSDIQVPPNYLRRVVAPLSDPKIGVVTCLYRAGAEDLPGRWEALGIATDFGPSVLVARLVSVSEFALGSTLVFRAVDLERIGGFAVLGNYIADDYQLGKRISALGRRIVLSKLIVETNLAGETWGEVWRHQLRWARTIRVSRGDGYPGLPVTNASFWALVILLLGHWGIAAGLLGLRLLAALLIGGGVLGSRLVVSHFVLIPFRDLWGLAVWCGGLFGNKVTWRDSVVTLSRDGRIENLAPVNLPKEPSAGSTLASHRQTR